MERITTKHRVVSGIAFGVYILLLIYFMFFADSLGRTVLYSEYQYNLVPLKEISRFITYSKKLGMGVVAANLLGNVIAFIPFGLFLPVLTKHRFGIVGMTVLSIELSMLIEILQLVSKVGSFDIDDIILNTLGGIIGYLLFRAIVVWRRKNVVEHE